MKFPPHILKALGLFLLFEGTCITFRSIVLYIVTGSALQTGIDTPFIVDVSYSVFQCCIGLGMILWFCKEIPLVWNFKLVQKKHLWLSLGVVLLFVLNNTLVSLYSSDAAAVNQLIYAQLGWLFLEMTFSSTGEELLYRGIVQPYINHHHSNTKSTISAGNLWASGIMVMRHLGFFAVFDFVFAVTGLLLVAIFSLVAGKIRRESKSLLLPILLHCICNYVFLSVHAYFA